MSSREGGGVARRGIRCGSTRRTPGGRSRPLTLTFGLGWGFDGSLNHDLEKPPLLEPLLGSDGLGPTRRVWTNFSPTAGIAWTISPDKRTVFRAGGGRLYRPHGLTSSMDAERVALGPRWSRPADVCRHLDSNPVPGIAGVPVGAPLDFGNAPSRLTGADLMAALPTIRAGLAGRLANADPTVQQIQIVKQAVAGDLSCRCPQPVGAAHECRPSARALGEASSVSADVVYRDFVRRAAKRRRARPQSFRQRPRPRDPGVQRCPANDPHALCSLGPINVQVAPFRFTYKGLLLRAENVCRMRFGSSAPTRIRAIRAPTSAMASISRTGSRTGDPRRRLHTSLNVAGTRGCRGRFQVGLNFDTRARRRSARSLAESTSTATALTRTCCRGRQRMRSTEAWNARISNGSSTQFNQTHAGDADAKGADIPTLTLPPRYSFGDNVHGSICD